jgi:hypothetical protein
MLKVMTNSCDDSSKEKNKERKREKEVGTLMGQ